MAIGDLHGDLQKTVIALKLAGVLSISTEGTPLWCGGDTIIVQLGDILDRGDHEIQILHLFLRLKEQAKAQGGDVFLLNGNHESLNICGDFRYVTAGGFTESARVAGLPPEVSAQLSPSPPPLPLPRGRGGGGDGPLCRTSSNLCGQHFPNLPHLSH